jgi:ligand-binding sensor domain-containing protein
VITARPRLGRLVVAVLLTACAGTAGAPGRDRPPLALGRDDRIVIPAMNLVQGVALTPRYVFIATSAALGVYDRQFERWFPPVTRRDGWPGGVMQVFVGDPNDDVVWFATAAGLFRYRAILNDLARTSLADTPRQLFFDRGDPSVGAYVVGTQRIWRVSASGSAQVITASEVPPAIRRVVPATLGDIYARFPALRDFERLLTQDDDLRSYAVTSGAIAPERSEVWLGTAGAGVVQVDALFTTGTPRPFGLLEPGAGAIVATSDGVWIGGAGDRLTARSGLTYAEHELGRWRWLDGGTFAPMGGARVHALAPWASWLWVGTDRGLVRFDLASGRADRRLDESDGLPSSLVLSVAPRFDGVWVGTARGLAFVADTGRGARPFVVESPVLDNTPVRALVRRGDTLWIGTDAGVAVLPPNESRPRRLRSAELSVRLAQPVAALAIADSVLAVATTRGALLLLSTRDGSELAPLIADAGRTGGIAALAMDATSLWIAGPMGVLMVQRRTGVARFIPVGTELPGEATGVALARDYAWVATREGVVRLRRLSDGSVR